MDQMDPRAVWPNWETVRLIGRGSYGAVYEIRRSVFGETERAALKHIPVPWDEGEIAALESEGLSEAEIRSSFTERAKGLMDEYRLMMRLKDCPNVVNCHDVDCRERKDGPGWDVLIRMELLHSLPEQLNTRNWTEADSIALGRDLCTALEDCRKEKILHRDIKPQNIFLNDKGLAKLGDFGIARITSGASTATSRIGTYAYMAPEVYSGQRYSYQADLYSVGLVLYWLLNERRLPFLPLPPQSTSNSDRERAWLRRFRGDALPPPLHGRSALKQVVMKACAFEPKDRYQTAEEMRRALEEAAKAPPEPEPEPGDTGAAQPDPEPAQATPRRREEKREDPTPLRQQGEKRVADARVRLPEGWGDTPKQPQRQDGQVKPQQPERRSPPVRPQEPEKRTPPVRPQQPVRPQPNWPQQPVRPQPNWPQQPVRPQPIEKRLPTPQESGKEDKKKPDPGRKKAKEETGKRKGRGKLFVLLALILAGLGVAAFVLLKDKIVDISLEKLTGGTEVTREIRDTEDPPQELTTEELLEQGYARGEDGLFWKAENGVLTIRGSGPMQDFQIEQEDASPEELAWRKLGGEITEIVILEGVSSVGDGAFYRWARLKQVRLPEGLKSIGKNAFSSCRRLEKLSLPKGLETIGAEAFFDCDALVVQTLPEGLRSIGEYAFYDCDSITELLFPAGMESIGASAFFGCQELMNLTIPLSMKSIGEYAFDECSKLRFVRYAGNAKQWGSMKIGEGNESLAKAELLYEAS